MEMIVKLDLMREFLDLNQAFKQVIQSLERMEKVPFFQGESIRYAQAEVETACVDANRELFDHFAEIIENDARWAYKFRREYDRATRDPFGFYLELKEREDARKKRGLPPRAVLLPGWDEDDDEQSRECSANKRRMSHRRPHQHFRKRSGNRGIGARKGKAAQ
jgi:hypothetical protein